VEFEAIEAKLVKFRILNGANGWACCAALELGFLGVNYTPMKGFTPKSAPGTPAPSVVAVAEIAADTPEPTPVVEDTPAKMPWLL